MKKCLVLTVVLSLALTSWAFGGRVTHQGADPADHLMLVSASPDKLTQSHFRRIYWDGVKDSTDFVVPQGRALVITDVDFIFTLGNSQQNKTLSLRVNGRTVTIIPFQLDGIGYCVKSHMMNAGVIVGSGANISAITSGPGQLGNTFLRGYLVDTTVVQ